MTRAGERGGAAILVAFTLLVLMAAAALGASRNVVRELGLCGQMAQGAKAAGAAEAGLDGFLAWACGTGEPLGRLVGVPVPALPPAVAAGELAGPPAAGTRLGFEVRARRLGAWPQPGTGRGAGWGVADPDPPQPDQLWLVTATGRCEVPGPAAAGSQGFRQARELLMTAAPGSSGTPE